MRTYKRAAHTVYELHYHFVFITKYRKEAAGRDVGEAPVGGGILCARRGM